MAIRMSMCWSDVIAPEAGQPAGKPLQRAGERAQDAARNDWQDVLALLDCRIPCTGGLVITLGGLLAAMLAMLATCWLARRVRHALVRYGTHHPTTSRTSLYTLPRLANDAVLVVASTG